MKKITMVDGRTGVVEFPPLGDPLHYRVRWSNGTESAITPAQFQSAKKRAITAASNNGCVFSIFSWDCSFLRHFGGLELGQVAQHLFCVLIVDCRC